MGKKPAKTRVERTLHVQKEAIEDLRYWVETEPKVAKRVLNLIEAALRDPFRGIGKPEPLKHIGSDIWSRRVTQVDRLVYRVHNEFIDILQARYHY